MKRIWNQCIKELLQFKRDRLTLALALLLPLATLIIFGFAIRLETKNIPLAIQDFDQSPLSRAYIERLFATNQFKPAPWSGQGDPVAAIDRGIAKATVVIPPDFSRQIKAEKTSKVQVLVDGTDVNNARIIRNSIRAATDFFLRINHLQPDRNPVVARIRLWFNPGRKESLSIVPGVYALVLAVFPALLAAIAMVREKEQGTIIQVYASSLSAAELLLGKGLAYFLIGQCETVLVMGIGSLIFGLWFAGDPTPLLIGTSFFLLDSVMFGLLIGVRARDQTSAVQGVAIVSFLTTLLLSGFIYPLSNIPFPLSLISNVVPARYFIEVTRDAFVRGTGWAGIWFAVLMMILLALFFFNAALRALKQMQLPD